MLLNGLFGDGSLSHYGCTQIVLVSDACQRVGHGVFACALYHRLHILRDDGVLSCPLQRERHVAYGLCLGAVALHDWYLMATKQHARRVARHIMALPQYLRCAGLC